LSAFAFFIHSFAFVLGSELAQKMGDARVFARHYLYQ
jgi:hypothetical protein